MLAPIRNRRSTPPREGKRHGAAMQKEGAPVRFPSRNCGGVGRSGLFFKSRPHASPAGRCGSPLSRFALFAEHARRPGGKPDGGTTLCVAAPCRFVAVGRWAATPDWGELWPPKS